jgi:uncharacterized phosphosugar-binding protein
VNLEPLTAEGSLAERNRKRERTSFFGFFVLFASFGKDGFLFCLPGLPLWSKGAWPKETEREKEPPFSVFLFFSLLSAKTVSSFAPRPGSLWSLAVDPSLEFLNRCREIVDEVERQRPAILQAADWFAATILAGRMVHLFGSGHSRILVEEMWPRYGSFPGFNPIVELSLSFHNLVVGANGQRQAMFLENVSGLAERILRNFDLSPQDSALVISSSGCNLVPIEMAAGFQQRGIRVTAILSRRHAEASRSQHPSGKKLSDYADLVLDTGAPVGDAMVRVPGLETPVSPGSTVGGCLLVNAIKAEVAARLTRAGHPPRVLTAPAVVGSEKAARIFEAAYDEHARRLARLYANLGATPQTEPGTHPPGRKQGS